MRETPARWLAVKTGSGLPSLGEKEGAPSGSFSLASIAPRGMTVSNGGSVKLRACASRLRATW